MKSVGKSRTRLVPWFQDIVECPDKEHFVRSITSSAVLSANGDQLLTVKALLTAPAKSFSIFRVFIHRCANGAQGSCEYFTTWTWDVGVCALLRANGTVWAPLVRSIVPKFACPVKSGAYSANNASLDFEAVEKTTRGLQAEKYTWRIEFQLFDELRAMFMCVQLLAKVNRVKLRNDAELKHAELQPNRSAMRGPRPGRTAFMITVNSCA
ncbi:Hydroxylysine kinase, partial [Frankliniella fusca]